MIQSIAQRIRDGNFTLAELAAAVGLTAEQLKNRLDLMVRQGYIVQEAACAPAESDGCGCHACCACGSRDPCAISPVRYRLTEKGKHLIGKTEGQSDPRTFRSS